MARATIRALEAVQADYVVTAGASCAAAIMRECARLLRDEPSWSERARRLAERTLDLVSLLERVADPQPLTSTGAVPRTPRRNPWRSASETRTGEGNEHREKLRTPLPCPPARPVGALEATPRGRCR